MKRRPLPQKVEQFLHRQQLSAGGLVVAVSGGPDSVALLRALLAVRPAGAGTLVVAHLNHQLRGGDSDADEAFVRELHARLASEVGDVQLRCERLDVAGRAREAHDNLEKTARQVRYGWLADVARGAGLRHIATGHTANDQAETVLHRLLRGTGVQGLRGIAPRRVLPDGIEVVRPLLGVTRAEVLAYLEELGQPFRHDATNADLRRTRNRIRHELLPHLAGQYNPRVIEVLGRLAEQADALYRLEEEAARRLLVEAERPRAGELLVFDRGVLAAAPRQRVREAFRLAWQREGWPLAGLGFEHWERLAELVFGGASAVDLPGGIRARRAGRVVQLGRFAAR